MRRSALVKAVVLGAVLLAAIGLAVVLGAPDVEALRSQVGAAGAWGPALFVLLYAGQIGRAHV